MAELCKSRKLDLRFRPRGRWRVRWVQAAVVDPAFANHGPRIDLVELLPDGSDKLRSFFQGLGQLGFGVEHEVDIGSRGS